MTPARSTRAQRLDPISPTSVVQRLAPILAAIGIALAAFLWLAHLHPPGIITDDSTRDDLLARDCVELGRCHLLGAPSSLAGFFHGALLVDLLVAVRLLGAGGERTVVLAFLAMSAATLFIVLWRWGRASIALPAAVLLIAGLSLDSPLLINNSVTVFPDVLTAAALLCYGLSGQRRYLIAAAFSLAVAISVHGASLSLMAPLLAIAAAARARPWRAVAIALAVVAATCLLTSSATLRANAIAIAERGYLLPGIVIGLVVVLVAASLGVRFRRLSWDARAWLIGIVIVLPFALALLWLSVAERHHFSVLYLHPVLGPGAALIAAALCTPFDLAAHWLSGLRWTPTAAASAAIALLLVDASQPAASRDAAQSWSFAEATAIAERATARGWSYEDLVLRVQGTACRDLLRAMSVVAAAPGPSSTSDHDGRHLQVVKIQRDAIPALTDGDGVVALSPTAAAILRDIESWLRPRNLRACRTAVGVGSSPRCSTATPRESDAYTPERFLFSMRSFPEVHALDVPLPYVASYEIPLAPVPGESRELTLTDHPGGDCGWRFTRADGVRVDGSLPARRVRLYATGAAASVVVERPFGTAACGRGFPDMRYLPCVLETRPGDPLQSLVEMG